MKAINTITSILLIFILSTLLKGEICHAYEIENNDIKIMLKRSHKIVDYAITFDEKYIITHNNKEIAIWDAEKLTLIKKIQRKNRNIYTHPTDSRLLYFNNFESGKYYNILDWPTDSIVGKLRQVYINQGFDRGNYLSSISDEGEMMIWALSGSFNENDRLGIIGGPSLSNIGSVRANHNDSLIVTSGNYPLIFDLHKGQLTAVIPYYDFLKSDTSLHFESPSYMPIPKSWTTSVKNKLFYYDFHNFVNSYFSDDNKILLGGINGYITEWNHQGELSGIANTGVGPSFSITWKDNNIVAATRKGLFGSEVASVLPPLKELNDIAGSTMINVVSTPYNKDHYLIGTNGIGGKGKVSLFESRFGNPKPTRIAEEWTTKIHDIKISGNEQFAAIVYGNNGLTRLNLSTFKNCGALKLPDMSWDFINCCEILPDNSIITGTHNGKLYYIAPDSMKATMELKHEHTTFDAINIGEDGKRLYISGGNRISIWDTKTVTRIMDIIPFYDNNYHIGSLFITPDHYYKIDKHINDELNFVKGTETYTLDQFDMKYNRPDIILQRLGGDKTLINLYNKTYKKRLKRMELSEDMLSSDFHHPEVTISNYDRIPRLTEKDNIDLELNLKDTKHTLKSVFISINGVPIAGISGIDVSDKQTKELNITQNIQLTTGLNIIKVSCMNTTGAESYKTAIHVNYNPGKEQKPTLYVASVGVSTYADAGRNLNYASKDATDFTKLFKSGNHFADIKTLLIKDNDFSHSSLNLISNFFSKAERNDVVMLFYAGHGLLSSDLDYFLSTYNTDFKCPQNDGIAYDDFVNILDKTKSLYRYCFIDACHSGEISKEDYLAQNVISIPNEAGNIVFRGTDKLIAQSAETEKINSLLNDLFSDFRWGVGATVVSSSGGTEYAMESDLWKNGLFTYCLKEALMNNVADTDNSGTISATEWIDYTIKRVSSLSEKRQSPTLRAGNYHNNIILK